MVIFTEEILNRKLRFFAAYVTRHYLRNVARIKSWQSLINQFLAHVSILCSLKTQENQRFLGVFRGCKMGTLARNRLRYYHME